MLARPHLTVIQRVAAPAEMQSFGAAFPKLSARSRRVPKLAPIQAKKFLHLSQKRDFS
jgi:hypothetical protein